MIFFSGSGPILNCMQMYSITIIGRQAKLRKAGQSELRSDSKHDLAIGWPYAWFYYDRIPKPILQVATEGQNPRDLILFQRAFQNYELFVWKMKTFRVFFFTKILRLLFATKLMFEGFTVIFMILLCCKTKPSSSCPKSNFAENIWVETIS